MDRPWSVNPPTAIPAPSHAIPTLSHTIPALSHVIPAQAGIYSHTRTDTSNQPIRI